MLPLTFLKHATKPLTKIFEADGSVTQFPHVKKLTSSVIECETLHDVYEAIKDNAAKNRWLLKGELTEPIVNESRANKTNKNEKNQLFVLDFDGISLSKAKIKTPITEAALCRIANSTLALLPQEFQTADHIIQASSSFGTKSNNLISLHIFFLLDKPLVPSQQKDILLYLNFADKIKPQLKLSANGKTLHYLVDIMMANNAMGVYIAPPVFIGKQTDPVTKRIIFVEGENDFLTTKALLQNANPAKLDNLVKNHIKKLRADAGLSNEAVKSKSYMYDGIQRSLITNPDRMRIDFVRAAGDFAYFNINGGDSEAYYCTITSPDLVHNFKGEPSFLMSVADPEFYEWFLTETLGQEDTEEIRDLAGTQHPFVFRDYLSGNHFNGFIDTETETIISCNEAGKGDFDHFMEQHDAVTPDPIPTMEYIYNPTEITGINRRTGTMGWVNRYKPTPYIIRDSHLPNDTKIRYKETVSLKTHAPICYKIIRHVLGDGLPEYRHFIHWLAWIIQNRNKTQTAWIITGCPGTGKQLLYNNIINPLIGVCPVSNDQEMFNPFVANNLMLVLDEFELANAKNEKLMSANLRQWISEETISVRAHYQGQRKETTYCNVMIFSNSFATVKIPQEEERRLNVSPRQEISLATKYPDIREEVPLIEDELDALFAYLNSIEVDDNVVKTVLDNEAKMLLRDSSENSTEEFCRAIRTGNLDFFVDNIMTVLHTGNPIMDIALTNAQDTVKFWIAAMASGVKLGVHLDAITDIYKVMFSKSMTPPKMKHLLLVTGGIPNAPSRIRVKGTRKMGWEIEFSLRTMSKQEAIDEFLSPLELKQLSKALEIKKFKTK